MEIGEQLLELLKILTFIQYIPIYQQPSIISILIAASGLFGLTLFTARTRTKEIGIKKVFGCSGKSIIYSFLKENFILLLIATLLSIPITLYFMTKWLNNFTYKI